jgi:DNA replication protein DnaC
MTIDTIRDQFKKLRLPTAALELEGVLDKRKKSTDVQWLSELLSIELDARRDHTIERKIKRADFPQRTSFEQFNWEFNKKLPREKIEQLRDLKWISQNEIVLFLGSPGTGKTHLAIALGLSAVQEGHSVFCTSVKRLGTKIKKAREANKLDVLFKQILTSKLWILDDWGVVSMSRDISEEIFDLFDRRKNNSAMIITSNRDVDEWPQVFSDPVLASAAIDRMFEDASISIFEGPSHRMKSRIIFREIDKE